MVFSSFSWSVLVLVFLVLCLFEVSSSVSRWLCGVLFGLCWCCLVLVSHVVFGCFFLLF